MGSTTRYRKPRLPPVTRCELCGRSLLCTPRYHVKLVLRSGPLAGTVARVLHVCRDCLEGLKADKRLRERFRIRYYRMSNLCTRHKVYI